ncbi:MFS transporter [Microbacterium sp. CH-015]|uniref:MFS transporter n=1 Tax=Microbacterium sp. CH-015 TaxID=3406734 RepID=UPI003C725B61
MTTSHTAPAGGTTSTRALVVSSAALFTDMLVHGLAVPVLPLLPAVVEAGPAATGVLFSSHAVAMIIATLFAGRIVDRYGPRTPLLIGLVGLAAATLLFATGGPYWLLLVARLAQGIAGGMSWVAALSLIAATTPMQRRGQSMGIALSTITLGVLIGPPIAGFLVEHLGTAAPFLFAAAVALADGVLRIILVKDSPRVTDDTAGPLAVLKVPGSLSIVLAVAVGAAVLSGIEPVLPVHLGASALTVGLLFGLAALASIIANPIVGRYVAVAPPRILVGIGVGAVAAALVVTGFATELWQTSIGMVLLGASSALLLAPATTLISEQGYRSTPPTLGGSFALYNLAYALGLASGPLLTGLSVGQWGFTAAMTITAAVLALLGGASLLRLPTATRS